ncbi:MAG: hypothetical protein ABIR91_04845 [Candidatus Saccharimonadales bacterium]
MNPNDKQPTETTDDQPAGSGSQAPNDALSRTPDDLDTEQAAQTAANPTPVVSVKKQSSLKKFLRKVNIYFLIFLLLVVVAGAITAVNYLNSQKSAPEASIATQDLTEDALKQLANTDASVGNAAQTLTIQGNAIISGETLMRGNLNVAGNIQAGGKLQAPSLTISGETNLASTQINTLQVAQNTAVQGSTTLRDLNVSGSSSFSGALTASQITVSKLILSGNAILQIPNHISFTGPAPGRSINSSVLGGGGTATISGSDTTGTVRINSGNNPSAGCFVRINFRQNFSNEPHVLITPVGEAAGRTQFYVTRDRAGFSICSSNAAPGNSAFAYDYFVTN